MTRADFIQQFILSRTSHKKDINVLLIEADLAWRYSLKDTTPNQQ